MVIHSRRCRIVTRDTITKRLGFLFDDFMFCPTNLNQTDDEFQSVFVALPTRKARRHAVASFSENFLKQRRSTSEKPSEKPQRLCRAQVRHQWMDGLRMRQFATPLTPWVRLVPTSGFMLRCLMFLEKEKYSSFDRIASCLMERDRGAARYIFTTKERRRIVGHL